MSQAEELLNSMSEEIPVHAHAVPDTDTYFIIDPITRKIENTNRKKSVVMQYDHNSERFTFELPRYVDGHDMLKCTSVIVNVDNIEASEEVEPRINSDAPSMTDLQTHPNDPDKVVSSWLVSRNSTQLAGILSFSIEYKCVDSNGNVAYEWSTDSYDEIEVRARKKNGEASVMDYTDVLEQWRTQIFGAGDSVIANIAAEGEAQVAAVKAESETQQEAVELKGAQTLDTIPEDYTKVDAMADEAVRTKADAIVCEATGESIVINDSSDDHIRGLRVFGKSTQKTTTGKNLLNLDESVTFEYVLTLSVSIPAGTYILSYDSESHTGDYPPYVRFEDNATGALLTSSPKQYTITLTKEETTIHVYSNNYNAPNSRGVEATVNQLMLSVDGGEYEPYTGGKPAPNPDYPQELVSIENPIINVCGKNLLELTASTETINGVTFVINDDGTVDVNGTATESILFDISYRPSGIEANAKYFLCGCPSGGGDARYYLRVSDRLTQAHDDYGSGIKFKYSNVSNLTVSIRVMSGVTVSNLTFKPMICAAAVTDHVFESYKPIQSIDIPHALPGIPVTSGGNYTDSDGQQWICDEVDLERGVYVQLVNVRTYTGAETYQDNISYYGVITTATWHKSNTGFLCTHGTEGGAVKWANDNHISFKAQDFGVSSVNELVARLTEWNEAGKPLMVAYVLREPIETPLTAEEITAFKALRTNKPNTTILNDAGAWMSVKYNADTKTYVENPKVLKLVDSSTGVVYELKVVDGVLTVIPV